MSYCSSHDNSHYRCIRALSPREPCIAVHSEKLLGVFTKDDHTRPVAQELNSSI